MKKILFFVLTALTFAACEQALVEEQSATCPDVPETITVGFEGEDTRIQLNDVQKTVWTSGDLVSVFYRSDANQKWQYTGETGARTADLTCVDAGEATKETQRVVVVYPYNANYYFNTETYNVQASLPATQTYLKDSYGLDGNIMVSSSEFNQFKLKTVYGWLKLQLTGNGEQVKSITVRGNNGEQVAGELYINSVDATSILASDSGASDDDSEAGGSLIFEDTILTEVTLDCSEGVALGKEATAFYIALPPQTFEKGFTVDITTINGLVMTQSTDKEVVIERNHIQPMTAFTADFHIPETWKIYYTATQKVEPYDKTVFGATYLSNDWDSETGEGVITFDGDVTTIGNNAFRFRNRLTSVTIPDSVTWIGGWAFNECSKLTSINIPDGVTTIEYQAFLYCNSLTNITIPDSVTSIKGGAFECCGSLTSVTIPESVTSIESRAFAFCSNLTSVTIPNSVTRIEAMTFWECDSLPSVTIPDSVTFIGSRAFEACVSLTSVTIPDSVTFIDGSAFEGCISLPSVTIPDSVTRIGDCAFRYCSSLTEFKGKFASEDGRCLNEDGVLNSFAPYGLTEYTIPDSVTTIGDGAFQGCSSLTSVTIPDSVTSIESTAFSRCSSLTSVTIGDSVTTIGDWAFYHCDNLTSVTIPDSVTTIGEHAFIYCSSLTSVTIGDSVTTIGEYAFAGCSSLTSVYCKATTPPRGDTAMLDSTPLGLKIYVPVNSVNSYKNASYWRKYANSIVGYDFNQ